MKQKPSYYQQTSGLTRWRSSKQVQLSKTQVMVCFVGVYKTDPLKYLKITINHLTFFSTDSTSTQKT